jgi:hypothetical protein
MNKNDPYTSDSLSRMAAQFPVMPIANIPEISNTQKVYYLPWQPISTAPMDGTVILASLPHSDIPYVIRFGLTGWIMCWDNYNLSEYDAPTHWMPIPKTPKK